MNSKADNWKNELREKIIKCIIGNASQKDYADIAYAYHWLAPSSIYKYYSDDLRNVENTRNNAMWYSAPSKFNDVFDAVLSADRDAIDPASVFSAKSEYFNRIAEIINA